MKDFDAKRRQLLQLLVCAPLGLSIGCGTERSKTTSDEVLLSPEESLRKLILVLGPWSAAGSQEAEDFAERFLTAKHAIDPYLPESAELIKSLAGRFPEDGTAVKEVNLRDLPDRERELLLALSRQIYSLTEVRFQIAGQPPIGECQGNATLHTLAPL
jgi:hypothetical protein